MQQNGYVGRKIGLFIFIIVLFVVAAILFYYNKKDYQNNVLITIDDNGNSSITKEEKYQWCLGDKCNNLTSSNYVCMAGDHLNVELIVNNYNNINDLKSFTISNDNVKKENQYVILGGDKTIYKYELVCEKVGITELIATGSNEKETKSSIQILDEVNKTETINISMATKKMFVGDTDIISVDFNPVNATNQYLRWYTSDEKVVEVNNDGMIVAKSPGVARIKAIAWNDDTLYYESHVDVQVSSNASKPYVGFNLSNYICSSGSSIKITTKACNDDIKNIASEDSLIANVSGMINYRESNNCKLYTYVIDCKLLGETELVVDGSSNTSRVPIKVVSEYIPSKEITLGDYGFRNIEVGESINLSATVTPSNATNKKVYWSSSNPKAFIVDQEGNLEAVGNGKSQITAIVYNDDTISYSDSILFNAYSSIDDLTPSDMLYFDREIGECRKGKTIDVTLHLSYADSKNINLVGKVDKIKSLDNSIATIAKQSNQTSMCLGCIDYEIKCNKAGTTKIEATTTKGGKAIYTIKVK